MRTLLAFAPLLLTALLLQLGSGVLGPLGALSAAAEGFTERQIGLLGSAHFSGFFLGCLLAPGMIARTGHSRAFAALSAVGIVCVLLHTLWIDPYAWMLFRVGSGMTIAGGYTVVESWLNARVENANRGRTLGAYRMIDICGAIASQLMILQLDPAAYTAYVVVAIIGVLSLVPLSLTTVAPPAAVARPRLRIWRAVALSPLGAAGVLVAGLTNASFRMVGPVYGAAFSLSKDEIAWFMAAALAGGAVAQPIAGYLSDRVDRRRVLIGASALACVICLWLSTGVAEGGFRTLVAGAFLFGVASFSIYSISAAHANDFAPPDFVIELNASMLFVFAIGAIVSPVLVAELIGRFGPSAMWRFIAAAHVFLILFGLYRMTRRPSAAERTPYEYRPRTSPALADLMRPSGDAAESQAPGRGHGAVDGRAAPPADR